MAWHALSNTFSSSLPEQTIEHNLGLIPDIIIVIARTYPPTSGGLLASGGYSSRLLEAIIETSGEYQTPPTVLLTERGSAVSITQIYGIESNENSQEVSGMVRNCTDTSFVVGSPNYSYTSLIPGTYNLFMMWNDGELDGDGTLPTSKLYSPMRRGGYQILDLKNHDFNVDEAYKIDGVYKLLQETRKVVMVSGLKISGIEFDSSMTSFSLIDFKFVAKINAYYIIVEDNDNVTITETPIQQTIFITEEDDL